MDIQELQNLVCAFRDERNWKAFHNPKDMILSLSLEAAELLELTQWKNQAEIEKEFNHNPEALKDELADILYWVLLIANDYKVNLSEALKSKLNKNAEKYPAEISKDCKLKYDQLELLK